jgi:hypothetical protein
MELLAPQDEPHEEEAGDQAPAEEEEEPATEEWAALPEAFLRGWAPRTDNGEVQHEEDEEASATEAGGSNESEGAYGDEELPVSQAGLPGGRR